LPVVLDDSFIETLRQQLPELPDARQQRFIEQHQLSAYDASFLSNDANMARYFEMVAKTCGDSKLAANWCMGELSAHLNNHELSIKQSPVSAEALAQLILRIKDGTISGKMAKDIFEGLWKQQGE